MSLEAVLFGRMDPKSCLDYLRTQQSADLLIEFNRLEQCSPYLIDKLLQNVNHLLSILMLVPFEQKDTIDCIQDRIHIIIKQEKYTTKCLVKNEKNLLKLSYAPFPLSELFINLIKYSGRDYIPSTEIIARLYVLLKIEVPDGTGNIIDAIVKISKNMKKFDSKYIGQIFQMSDDIAIPRFIELCVRLFHCDSFPLEMFEKANFFKSILLFLESSTLKITNSVLIAISDLSTTINGFQCLVLYKILDMVVPRLETKCKESIPSITGGDQNNNNIIYQTNPYYDFNDRCTKLNGNITELMLLELLSSFYRSPSIELINSGILNEKLRDWKLIDRLLEFNFENSFIQKTHIAFNLWNYFFLVPAARHIFDFESIRTIIIMGISSDHMVTIKSLYSLTVTISLYPNPLDNVIREMLESLGHSSHAFGHRVMSMYSSSNINDLSVCYELLRIIIKTPMGLEYMNECGLLTFLAHINPNNLPEMHFYNQQLVYLMGNLSAPPTNSLYSDLNLN